MTSLRIGQRVEWRSLGERRPFVFFRGTIVELPTKGKWAGVALVDDDSELTPRPVSVTRLIASKAAPRSVPLGGGTRGAA